MSIDVSKKHIACLPRVFRLVSCSAYSSTLEMEAMIFSETSVDFKETARRNIREDSIIQLFSIQFISVVFNAKHIQK
jgi:hypothetical protein